MYKKYEYKFREINLFPKDILCDSVFVLPYYQMSMILTD